MRALATPRRALPPRSEASFPIPRRLRGGSAHRRLWPAFPWLWVLASPCRLPRRLGASTAGGPGRRKPRSAGVEPRVRWACARRCAGSSGPQSVLPPGSSSAPSQTRLALGLPGPFPPVGGEDPEKPFCPCSELSQPEGSPQSNSLPSTAWGVRGRAPPMAWPEICTQAPPGRPRSLTQRRSFLLKWEAEWKLNPGWQGPGQGDKRS